MKRLILITATVVMAFGFILVPAVASPDGEAAISVTPAEVSFGNIVPGIDVAGPRLTIANNGSTSVLVCIEIINDTDGFFDNYLKLNGVDVSSWTAIIDVDDSPITVTTRLEGVPSYLEPGSYSCTVIFWAEATE